MERFQKEFKFFTNKSLSTKHLLFSIKDEYRFAQYCKTLLPYKHNAKMLTDMNLSQDPGMLIHRKLSYYLYPIDIRGIRGKSYNHLIFFEKQNASSVIPKNFQIHKVFNKKNFIASKQ